MIPARRLSERQYNAFLLAHIALSLREATASAGSEDEQVAALEKQFCETDRPLRAHEHKNVFLFRKR